MQSVSKFERLFIREFLEKFYTILKFIIKEPHFLNNPKANVMYNTYIYQSHEILK